MQNEIESLFEIVYCSLQKRNWNHHALLKAFILPLQYILLWLQYTSSTQLYKMAVICNLTHIRNLFWWHIYREWEHTNKIVLLLCVGPNVINHSLLFAKNIYSLIILYCNICSIYSKSSFWDPTFIVMKSISKIKTKVHYN